MTTHITYKTAKKLKEFLGEGAVEPIEYLVYAKSDTTNKINIYDVGEGAYCYQLHDLLSKPFCVEMAKRITASKEPSYVSTGIFWAYYLGGLPAVEKALEEMMK